MPIESDDPPLGWARVTYDRAHAVDDNQCAHTTLTTHACDRCSSEVLAFLEKVVARKDIDRAFDDGGDA